MGCRCRNKDAEQEEPLKCWRFVQHQFVPRQRLSSKTAAAALASLRKLCPCPRRATPYPASQPAFALCRGGMLHQTSCRYVELVSRLSSSSGRPPALYFLWRSPNILLRVDIMDARCQHLPVTALPCARPPGRWPSGCSAILRSSPGEGREGEDLWDRARDHDRGERFRTVRLPAAASSSA